MTKHYLLLLLLSVPRTLVSTIDDYMRTDVGAVLGILAAAGLCTVSFWAGMRYGTNYYIHYKRRQVTRQQAEIDALQKQVRSLQATLMTRARAAQLLYSAAAGRTGIQNPIR